MANSAFIYILAGILLIPLIPAFILYKFLPSKATVTGPFKGLNLKLSGSFGGYFLLVLVSSGIFFPLLRNEQQKTIDELRNELSNLQNEKNNQQHWTMEGSVISSIPKETRIFFDQEGSDFFETGDFKMNFNCSLENGLPELPKALCIFNKQDGYKVINMNQTLNASDIVTYGIQFDSSKHYIRIGQKIDIESKKAEEKRIAKELYEDLQQQHVNVPNHSKIYMILNPSVIKTQPSRQPK
ncbi:MAG: hypothetical protein ACHQET_01875 [Chitinophagales bacterium]